MLSYRVKYYNIRPPNMLWNPEIRSIMLVDFKCLEIFKQIPILEEISPNRKRKHFYLNNNIAWSSRKILLLAFLLTLGTRRGLQSI